MLEPDAGRGRHVIQNPDCRIYCADAIAAEMLHESWAEPIRNHRQVPPIFMTEAHGATEIALLRISVRNRHPRFVRTKQREAERSKRNGAQQAYDKEASKHRQAAVYRMNAAGSPASFR